MEGQKIIIFFKKNKCIITFILLLFILLGMINYLVVLNNKIDNSLKHILKVEKENKILKIEKQEIEKQLLFINSLDLHNDNSLTKFVNSSVSFNDKSYVPENLEKIGSDFVYDSKGGRQVVRKETNESLQKLSKEFKNKFNKKLTVVSAYRSYEYQKGIKNRGCPDNLCAKAGYSEHQSGLAIDIFEASTELNWKKSPVLTSYYNWLNENAHKYGFHNTYQKGLKIDGYEIEPWHWRYVGIELATHLKEKNITIAEFYFNNK